MARSAVDGQRSVGRSFRRVVRDGGTEVSVKCPYQARESIWLIAFVSRKVPDLHPPSSILHPVQQCTAWGTASIVDRRR
ncbi:hypothetical protein E4U43_003926 [Claviceps pusilla]|uniref:Uncharacterized protein n=1 Tax=Claviceps pusilla TaxID=123648 RepID=A0A9P7N4S7_9HYPO|nr:hypothetical protein E4U43_003926 [Claviceps pusilla]